MADTSLASALRILGRRVADEDRAAWSDARLLEGFLATADEAAFAVLVKRHGPMVLGVCRAVLGDLHDAEEAFQASFLLLIRRAGSIRKKSSLAGWLHGVAYRTALKVQRSAARRRQRERQVQPMALFTPSNDPSWHEVRGILLEEIERLPARYREVFLLCCQDEKSRRDAARLLGLKEGTVASRLDWARKRLRQRLTRRGIEAPAVVIGLTAVRESLAAGLVRATLQGAVGSLKGNTVAGCSASVATLVAAMSRTMTLGRLRVLVCCLLVSVGLAGVLVGGIALDGEKKATPAAPPPVEKACGADKAALDVFGDPLPEQAIARLGTIRFRHGRALSAVALSSDRKMIASVNHTHEICLWDAASGKPVARIHCPQIVYTVAISPNGKLLAAGGWGGPVYILDRADGRVVHKLTNRRNRFNAVAFSPDGKLLASGSNVADGVVLWDVATGKLVRELIRAKQDTVWSSPGPQPLAFAPDGQTLATIFGNEIRLWNFHTGRLLHVLRKHERPIHAVAFAAEGNLLASAGQDGAALLWDWKDGSFRGPLEPDGHSRSGFSALAFSPSGKTLAVSTGYLDNDHSVVRLWRIDGRQHVRSISWKAEPLLNPVHNTGISCLVFGTEDQLLGGDIHGMIRVWDLSAGDVSAGKDAPPGGGWTVPSRWQDQGHDEPIHGIAVSPDGKVVATGADDATVRIWDARTGREMKRLFASRDVRGLTFSPDGKLLGAVDLNDWLSLWETGTWKQVRLEKDMYARSLAFSPDGKTLAVGGIGYRTGNWNGGAIVLVDRQTFREIRRVEKISEQVLSLAFSPDGRLLIGGASGERHNGPMPQGGLKFDVNVVHVWEVATGRELVQFGGSKMWTTALALSPDGRSLVAVGHDEFRSGGFPEALSLWEVASGQERARLEPSNGRTCAAAFSPDGKFLATSGLFDAIRLWDLTTGRRVHSFGFGHNGPVTGLAFAPDGKTLFSCSEDCTGLVWKVPALAGPKPPAVSEKEWPSLWQSLASRDAKAAFHTVQTLKMLPREATTFLGAQLIMPAKPDDKYFRRCMDDLNCSTFQRRAEAERGLVAAGDWAIPVLRKFLAGKINLEEKLRATKILERLEGRERWRVSRAMEVLAYMKTPEARSLLQTLASGPTELGVVREARRALRVD
jgi:RNA polymerase sigma factor (sigma-70 family)